ncbi:MAG: hypothetical protein R3C03_20055 [Pirellulaceae bacterium]
MEDSIELPIATRAISVGGHAHYICSSMTMTAVFQDGKQQILMEIDDWDLDWQDRYQFASPVELPAGTVLNTRITYDNSKDNPENPYSPPQRIRWGRESNDEMGSITLQVVAANESDRPTLERAVQTKLVDSVRGKIRKGNDLATLLMQLDQNRDGKLQLDEAPPRLSGRAFTIGDQNKDGALDEEELKRLAELAKRFGRIGNE